MTAHSRPKFLSLLKIKLPLTGVVSILHRISGVLLVLSLPIIISLFDQSLQGPAGFQTSASFIAQPVTLIIAVALIWAVAHHFFAGFRFLLFDLDMAVTKSKARFAATLVLLASMILTVYMVWWWFK
ncbi:MAG: succinate dehydrogenase, cytochrome b556 subunit [Gammaproteobacteria bacterium]|nr:succinate dehydrogenase, cytochrome b556 subunit [Gammaproteobacteria bacterium]